MGKAVIERLAEKIPAEGCVVEWPERCSKPGCQCGGVKRVPVSADDVRLAADCIAFVRRLVPEWEAAYLARDGIASGALRAQASRLAARIKEVE